ncbi:hypothetical protein [Cobetia sp. MC34]|uniref:hypothetical protein n=1 Tax=Cobetia sp. MC34 TaxID=2785080 RepID=UPI001BCA1349|nr:hypothetical protein [Cobetia sp. MC34]MBS4154967.1 hypothetical protein [Cobetia sp. MC34]
MDRFKISNPLTLISVFAGAAEAFAALALVNLPIEIQKIFVYFVMAFPIILVALFFYALLFNNKCLYAPSDFIDQNHYLLAHSLEQSVTESIDKSIQDFNYEKNENNISNAIDWNKFKKSVLSSLNERLAESSESQVYSYLDNNKGSFFTERSLRLTLPIDRVELIKALEKLKEEGLIEKGKERRDGISRTLWGINKTSEKSTSSNLK